MLTNPNIVSANSTLDDVKLSVNFDFMVDFPSPINVGFAIRHFSNGAYVKSFINIEIEFCSFLKTKHQNLVFRNVFDYIRKMGKMGTRCPLKRVRIYHGFNLVHCRAVKVFVSQDMCYVKDVQIPQSFIREVLPSDKFCLNYLMGQPLFINFTLYFRLLPKSKKM
jgi:Protein of unknown function (DUF1091)